MQSYRQEQATSIHNRVAAGQTRLLCFVSAMAATAMIVLLVVQVAGAGSLWGQNNHSLFADTKARQVGDLLTLIIVEQAEARQTATTQTGKDSEVGMGPFMGLLPQLPTVSAGGSDNSRASGTTTRGGSLRARMTIRVVELLPGGNMLVEGTQTIVVNGEEQELMVSGMVRDKDIAPDNSILSNYLADARISYRGSGALGDGQEPGLLTRFFRWIF